MSSTPLEALPIREGHFLLESGLHAEAWLDLDSLFLDPGVLAPQIDALATVISRHKVSAICGPLVGGAFVAQAIATQLGVRFYFTERVQSNPNELFQAVYRLSASQRARATTERFAVVDDVIGAGSAVRATMSELESLGAPTAVVGTLLILGSRAANHLTQLGVPLVSLGSKEIAIWKPQTCPLCNAGIPLQSVS